MNRVEAIKKIKSLHQGAIFIFSNGLTSREASNFCDDLNCFYLLHAMGEALSVGIGLASTLPDFQVVVVDGDGNALMGSSSWILNEQKNLHYYILKNGIFATTGNQKLPENISWPEYSKVLEIDKLNVINSSNPPSPTKIINKLENWINTKINEKS